ncbi:hypothetical protein D3C71_1473390 [compost metagenome]
MPIRFIDRAGHSSLNGFHNRCCGHRRLFGCQGKAQKVNQDKSECIIQTIQQRMTKITHMKFSKQYFEDTQKSNYQTCAHCSQQHIVIFLFRMGDIMFTRFCSMLSHLIRNRLRAVEHQTANIVFLTVVFNEFDCQINRVFPFILFTIRRQKR